MIWLAYCSHNTITIKLATLAPEGTVWVNILRDIGSELQEKSNGRLKLKIYSGGVAGDEIDVIRRMRISQMHCSAFTSLGLKEILPDIRVLDFTCVVDNCDVSDIVKQKLKKRLNFGFDENY